MLQRPDGLAITGTPAIVAAGAFVYRPKMGLESCFSEKLGKVVAAWPFVFGGETVGKNCTPLLGRIFLSGATSSIWHAAKACDIGDTDDLLINTTMCTLLEKPVD